MEMHDLPIRARPGNEPPPLIRFEASHHAKAREGVGVAIAADRLAHLADGAY